MKNKPAIFIGATGQHVGKTTTSLGIMTGLLKRFEKVGFIKPVGQRTVHSNGIAIDKDVALFKKYFSPKGKDQEMSPVVFPKGFTRDFLDGKTSKRELEQTIIQGYKTLEQQHDFMLVEGTGHTGVGSICGVDNASVAKILGLDAILVTSGGLGSAIDRLYVNLLPYRKLGVRVRGVIVNRVKEDKKEMLLHYLPKALKPLSLPLLGCIPYNYFLENPTMKDFLGLFSEKLISGHEHVLWHFEHIRLVATSLEIYQSIRIPNQLIITPASREDIILSKIKQHEKNLGDIKKEGAFGGGMILTGKKPPSKKVIDELQKSSLPCFHAAFPAYEVMRKISKFTAKIRVEDNFKVEKAMDLVERHVDFDQILHTGAY